MSSDDGCWTVEKKDRLFNIVIIIVIFVYWRLSYATDIERHMKVAMTNVRIL